MCVAPRACACSPAACCWVCLCCAALRLRARLRALHRAVGPWPPCSCAVLGLVPCGLARLCLGLDAHRWSRLLGIRHKGCIGEGTNTNFSRCMAWRAPSKYEQVKWASVLLEQWSQSLQANVGYAIWHVAHAGNQQSGISDIRVGDA